MGPFIRFSLRLMPGPVALPELIPGGSPIAVDPPPNPSAFGLHSPWHVRVPSTGVGMLHGFQHLRWTRGPGTQGPSWAPQLSSSVAMANSLCTGWSWMGTLEMGIFRQILLRKKNGFNTFFRFSFWGLRIFPKIFWHNQRNISSLAYELIV